MNIQDDFLDLLNTKNRIQNRTANSPIFDSNKPLKADRNATLYDFIEMLSFIINNTLENATFYPDEGKVLELDTQKEIKGVHISYKLLNKKLTGELKPRLREIFEEVDPDTQNTRVGEIYGQTMISEIQFNIFATNYKDANKALEKFEDIMFMFTNYFKKNGVAEVLYGDQRTDDDYNNLRNIVSVRNIVYKIKLEKIYIVFNDVIKQIDTLLNNNP